MKKLPLFLILIASIAFAADLPNVADDPIETLQFSFKGQWLPSADPLQIGPENYRELQNLRYTPVGTLESVGGYTKINTAVVSGAGTLDVDAGFHFKKSNPAETHVLVRADDGDIYQNKTAIPTPGNFLEPSLYTDASGAGDPRFSAAPYGSMAYTNEVESTIWAGDEMPCAAFVTSTAAITNTATNPKDYSFAVNNDLTTAENVAIIGGGNDAATTLLAHFDGADADQNDYTSEDTNTHTMTQEGTAQLDTAQKEFGVSSALFDGNSDYYHVTDNDAGADWWHLSGTWTIDFWFRNPASDVGTYFGVFQQYVDGNNMVSLVGNASSGAVIEFVFRIELAGDVKVAFASSAITGKENVWQHFALVRDATHYKMYLDGALVGAWEDADDWPDLATDLEIGRATEDWVGGDTTYYWKGWLDEFRVLTSVVRWSAAFTPPARPYSSPALTWLVGSPRPLQGVKFYVDEPNSQASTMTVKEYNGASWTELVAVDLTDDGPSLAQTGTVTWTSTVDTSKVKFLESRLYYWYQFSIDAGEATIYRATLNAPFQPILDIWDGVYRQPIQFQAYKSAIYEDYTLEVNDPLAVYYGVLGDMTNAEWLIVMSDDRLTALKWVMVAGKENTTAATVTIYYWDGDAWASVGTVSDTTLDEAGSTDSLAQSGVMSWEPPGIEAEFTRTLFGTTGYAYKLVWSDTLLTSSTHVNTLSGVPAQLTVPPFKFPVFYKDRLFLCGYTEGGEGNRCDFSVTHSPQAFNGQESSSGYGPDGYPQSLYLGGDEELTAAIELYNRVGSNIFDFLVVLKANETFVVYGDGPVFSYSQVHANIGCPAPRTLVTATTSPKTPDGLIKNVAIWVSYTGPIKFDGVAINAIPGLETYFDPNSSNYLGQTAIEGAHGFFDQTYGEYNFQVGSSWFVYNLDQKKWFTKATGAAADPISAWTVRDTYGNQYVYAGRADGFVVRLEHGTAWGATGIIQSVRTGDFFPTKSVWDLTRIRRAKIAYIRIADTNTMTMTHYIDGATAGSTVLTSDLKTGSNRIARATSPVNTLGWAHGFGWTVTIDDNQKGFQPLAWGVEYLRERKDY